MLDHIVLTVSDTDRSKAFYQAALAPLGIAYGVHYEGPHGHADLIGFGSDRAMYFWLKQGVPHPEAVHFAFPAESPQALRAFYDAALAAGGVDNGPPGHVQITIRAIMRPMCWTPMATMSKRFFVIIEAENPAPQQFSFSP
jgi:catechol 2,3-dioxygenase-like lactoylglutathione lyase family enzyme